MNNLSVILAGILSFSMSAKVFAAAPAKAEMQTVLTELQKLGGKPLESLKPAEARKQPTPADAVKQVLTNAAEKTEPEVVAKVEDQVLETPKGSLPARIYWPVGKGPFPVTVYFHGGGWVIANKDVYDAAPRSLVNQANTVVISVDYKQGPEHKFPAAHEDAFAAYQWALKNAAIIKGDPQRIAVVGESAGGNLAVAVSMMARDKKIQIPVYQVAVYPIASADMNSPSYNENAEAKPLNKAMMAWFFKNYLRKPADKKDPRINLLAANLKGLPPTTIITAQIDPLRDDGARLAEKLKEAGVPTDYKNFEGVTHEFFGMGAVVPEAKEATKFAATGLKTAFKPK